jgi:predicted transcriptional regulator
MSKIYIKVLPSATVTEALKLLHDNQQNCALVVDPEDFLEGIVTLGDIRRMGFELHGESFVDGDYLKTDVCLHGERTFFHPIEILLCFFNIWQDHCFFVHKEWFFSTT